MPLVWLLNKKLKAEMTCSHGPRVVIAPPTHTDARKSLTHTLIAVNY